MQRHIMNDRNSKPKQKRRIGTVSKLLLEGGVGGSLNRFYMATTLALSSAVVYTKNLFSPRVGVPNSLVQHLREHKNQTNTEITEMKQR